ncbi:unnamed protein product [Caenorhabditis auriculariae]|uniref:Uncharacterized protein n=1 Tax=Caenorhabditis auriculariae TaxID=2777116 RepID=A0A8S1HSZ2_9PELO|nr:unnamed protein product [Caenorhabditis auriculariae]
MKFLLSLVVVSAFAVLFAVVDSQEAGWSAWTDKPGASCNDTCGACGRIEQIRTCEDPDPATNCQGESEQLARCNFDICLFPRHPCCEGTKKAIDLENKLFVCQETEE